MKGSISFEKDRGSWVVSFFWKGKRHKIRRYKGEKMYDERIARKCLAIIQGRVEQYQQGLCTFRIEEFTGKGWTDVAEFYNEWMEEVVKPSKSPGTTKGYESYWNNWIKPFFEKNQVMLHEIQLDTLTKLKNSITLTGKSQYNILNCVHTMLDYAYRCNRIPAMPPFPKKGDYDLKEPDFKWMYEEEQMNVINSIPEEHRAPILWLKYHYRRPSEVCVLKWSDWDEVNRTFHIRRSYSKRILVEKTKTGKSHIIPCDSAFLPIIQEIRRNTNDGPDEFIFKNPRSRLNHGGYMPEALNKLWNKACKESEIEIELYEGTKHSSCTQFINEYDGTIDELQMLTDHARRDSLKHYAKVGVERKRRLMERRHLKLVANE